MDNNYAKNRETIRAAVLGTGNDDPCRARYQRDSRGPALDEEADRFLNAICQAADCFQLPSAQPPRLHDDDDEPLLRLAETSGARLITTHNLRHLRPAEKHGVTVLPPREFLRILSEQP